jgi:hypothetical protein
MIMMMGFLAVSRRKRIKYIGLIGWIQYARLCVPIISGERDLSPGLGHCRGPLGLNSLKQHPPRMGASFALRTLCLTGLVAFRQQ